MNEFKVGQNVLIKENAYGNSDDPSDVAARGKTGTIEAFEGGFWLVRIPGNQVLEFLFDGEIELVQP